jgi:hypothetical protein
VFVALFLLFLLLLLLLLLHLLQQLFGLRLWGTIFQR